MKTLRHLSARLALSLFLFSATIPLRAVVINWTGGGATGLISDPLNWDALFLGLGEDVAFGYTAGQTNVLITPTGVILNDITFSGTGRPDYFFSGTLLGLTLNGDLKVESIPGNITFDSSAPITLSAGTHDADIISDGLVTINSTVSGAGSSLSKSGGGTLALYGANTFTGGITVDAGWLRVGHNNALGTGTLTLNDGSTLSLDEEYAFALANNVTLDASGTVTIDTPDYSDLTLSGAIAGGAHIAKNGVGTLILNNPGSNFTGGLSLNSGELLLGADSSPGIAGPVGTGALKLYGGTTLGTTPGSFTLHNLIELDCNAANVVHVDIGSGDSLALYGAISGAAKLAKVGTGTLHLHGANTFTGALATGSNGGSIAIHGDTSAGLGGVQLGDYTGIQFFSTAPVIYGLQGGSFTSVNLAAGSVLTIDQDASSQFAGQIATTTASVVKDGTGTLTFSSANNYSGGTTIKEGVLVANHANGSNVVDALGSGSVTLDGGKLQIGAGMTFGNVLNLGLNGGKIGGNGIFSSPLTLGAGVTLAPGDSPGTLTFAAGLALNNGVITEFEISAPTNNPGVSSDLIAVTGGTLNLSALSTGGYTLKLISLLPDNSTPGAVSGLTGPASWTLFQATSITGSFDVADFTINSSQFVGGGIFNLSNPTAGNIVLSFTPVPEPSTYALLALGLGFVGLSVWRKRRRA